MESAAQPENTIQVDPGAVLNELQMINSQLTIDLAAERAVRKQLMQEVAEIRALLDQLGESHKEVHNAEDKDQGD